MLEYTMRNDLLAGLAGVVLGSAALTIEGVVLRRAHPEAAPDNGVWGLVTAVALGGAGLTALAAG